MFANVNGYKIYFDVDGLQYEPDGPKMKEKPVAFVLHGGPGGDHSLYVDAFAPLKEIFQLVYVDDRNCGLSERKDATTNSMKTNVEDLEALREYLGLDKIYIIGESYGGMKGQYYIINHPEHLYGAILASTAPNTASVDPMRIAEHVKEWGTEEQYDLWMHQDAYMGKLDFKDFMTRMGELYHAKGHYDPEAYINGMSRAIMSNEVINYQMSKGDMTNYDYIPELKNVTVPTLVLCGEKDFICDCAGNKEMADAIPNSEFHAIPEASHEIFADFPDVCKEYVKAFVERTFKK